MFDVGIYSSCGSQANCPTGCVNSVVQDYVVAHSWSVDAERAKFIVEKVSVPASRTGVLIHRINRLSKSVKLPLSGPRAKQKRLVQYHEHSKKQEKRLWHSERLKRVKLLCSRWPTIRT